MEYNEDLARLEQFVEKLIDSHNQLQNENSEMAARLQAKQQEISELQETIKTLQDDRNVMHNRVTGLIDRIDEWEKSFTPEEGSGNPGGDDENSRKHSKKSSSLFNVTPEQSSESVAG